MDTAIQQLRFELPSDPARFNALLDQILVDIDRSLADSPHAPNIRKKSRWIITELITNGYKHSGEAAIIIRIEFHPHGVHIIKEDTGSPLKLFLSDGEVICWPVGEQHYNRVINISHDPLNVLDGHIEPEGDVRFVVREKQPTDHDATKVNEHFGLIIIASLCNSFTYRFSNDGKNIFTSIIHFD